MTTSEASRAAARLAEFEAALRSHRWFFDRCDSRRVYDEGLEERARLEAMRRALIADGLKAEADALWEKHCPTGACA